MASFKDICSSKNFWFLVIFDYRLKIRFRYQYSGILDSLKKKEFSSFELAVVVDVVLDLFRDFWERMVLIPLLLPLTPVVSFLLLLRNLSLLLLVSLLSLSLNSLDLLYFLLSLSLLVTDLGPSHLNILLSKCAGQLQESEDSSVAQIVEIDLFLVDLRKFLRDLVY